MDSCLESDLMQRSTGCLMLRVMLVLPGSRVQWETFRGIHGLSCPTVLCDSVCAEKTFTGW